MKLDDIFDGKRFCPAGHDTWVVGRRRANNACRQCVRDRQGRDNARHRSDPDYRAWEAAYARSRWDHWSCYRQRVRRRAVANGKDAPIIEALEQRIKELMGNAQED